MATEFCPTASAKLLIRLLVSTCACVAAVSVTPAAADAQSEPVKTVVAKPEVDARAGVDEKHPLFKLLEVADKAKAALDDVDDYECIFNKQELVGKKVLKSSMKLKFRETPFSVYLKFLDLNQGREVLFVQGLNGNNLLVHEAGIKAIVGTVTVPPGGTDVMAENRYPVTSIGLRNMLTTTIKQWELEGKFGGITTQMRPNSKLPSGEVCTVYEAVHTQPFKEFKFHTTRLWIDNATGLAIGVQQLGFPTKKDAEPAIVEEYFYTKLKTNVKLTDADFDKNNPNYAYR